VSGRRKQGREEKNPTIAKNTMGKKTETGREKRKQKESGKGNQGEEHQLSGSN